jgi:hypothetical protein
MTASLEIQHLAQQWTEDRDSMSDEAREALLDWVRDEQDKWHRDMGPSTIPWHVAHELDLSHRLAQAICDEAGLEIEP